METTVASFIQIQVSPSLNSCTLTPYCLLPSHPRFISHHLVTSKYDPDSSLHSLPPKMNYHILPHRSLSILRSRTTGRKLPSRMPFILRHLVIPLRRATNSVDMVTPRAWISTSRCQTNHPRASPSPFRPHQTISLTYRLLSSEARLPSDSECLGVPVVVSMGLKDLIRRRLHW